MSIKNSSRFYETNFKDLELITSVLYEHFTSKEYLFDVNSVNNTVNIVLSKGSIFGSVSGTKTGLGIILEVMDNGINVTMKVDILKKQGLATAASMLLAWPLLVTQAWGIIKQNKLDKEAYEIIENVIFMNDSDSLNDSDINKTIEVQTGAKSFCTECGKELTGNFKFCPHCGNPVNEAK